MASPLIALIPAGGPSTIARPWCKKGYTARVHVTFSRNSSEHYSTESHRDPRSGLAGGLAARLRSLLYRLVDSYGMTECIQPPHRRERARAHAINLYWLLYRAITASSW